MKWYTDLVFIMDSKEKVYVYQTEKKSSNNNAKFDYPHYIGLRPDYLTTIEGKDFVSFLKNNNDIFGIFPNQEDVSTSFYIVSETDTIKNEALKSLNNALSSEKSRTIYLLRKTTEEENIVLKFKRSQQNFEPKNVKWSTNFYNVKVKPFTEGFNKYEKKIHSIIKAKETFKKKERMIAM